jgi:hypothetical protein
MAAKPARREKVEVEVEWIFELCAEKKRDRIY